MFINLQTQLNSFYFKTIVMVLVDEKNLSCLFVLNNKIKIIYPTFIYSHIKFELRWINSMT